MFEMIIVPRTARRFHEILLGTTMRQVTAPCSQLISLTIVLQCNDIFLDIDRYRRYDKQV